MNDIICMAVVSCTGNTHGFTDKASFKEFTEANEDSVDGQVLLILQGGAGATSSIKTALRLDWMMNKK